MTQARGAPVETRAHSNGGWHVEASCGPISGKAELDAIAAELQQPSCLPEMLFGSNRLTLTHEASGTQIVFSALNALRAWRERPPPPVVVQNAEAWKASRTEAIATAHAVQLSYDWTYTTDYAGTLVSSGDAAPCEWCATDKRMDRTQLLERAPILFAAEVPLYESEMDDNGVSSCTVRIRVMPKCWFLLFRFWLRVDDTLVRLREARCFCTAAAPGEVLREIKHCEGTFAELQAAGAPGHNGAYQDAEAAATALQAVAPVGAQLLQHEALCILEHA